MSRSRHVGKIQKRLEDVKNQWIRPARADLSDNESARLATDALLDGGPDAYRRALSREGEIDFLSSEETQYIQAHAKEPPSIPDPSGGAEGASRGLDSSSLQSGTYFPMASESIEPALLHNWTWAEKPYLKEKSSATVYFQRDKHNNIRDLVRRCISRASQVPTQSRAGVAWSWAGSKAGRPGLGVHPAVTGLPWNTDHWSLDPRPLRPMPDTTVSYVGRISFSGLSLLSLPVTQP
ncbi:protein FAM83A [Cricetulus griseus]|uniref:protein FAM83A n=1 Tax=Cricetulus griseus TaxID=10029 RepID=UPI0007DAA1D4|nr:protein FAM83A [Cricetulus griseus]